MASTSKTFKKCVDPCLHYLTLDDTYNLCIFCLGDEHARDVLEGEICVHCELLSMKKLCSHLSLFPSKEWQPSAYRDSGPIAAEARRRMKSWGSQLDVADGYAQEEQEMFEGEEVVTEPSQSSCPAYDELLEVMERKK